MFFVIKFRSWTYFFNAIPGGFNVFRDSLRLSEFNVELDEVAEAPRCEWSTWRFEKYKDWLEFF